MLPFSQHIYTCTHSNCNGFPLHMGLMLKSLPQSIRSSMTQAGPSIPNLCNITLLAYYSPVTQAFFRFFKHNKLFLALGPSYMLPGILLPYSSYCLSLNGSSIIISWSTPFFSSKAFVIIFMYIFVDSRCSTLGSQKPCLLYPVSNIIPGTLWVFNKCIFKLWLKKKNST